MRAHRTGPVAQRYKEGGGGMIYWQLLWSFFQIGLFSIGGGYAAMPLIQHQVVDVRPAVVAMIASAGLSILLLALFGSEVISLPLLDLRALGIFALALAALRIFKPDPIWVMAGAGVLGGILYSL